MVSNGHATGNNASIVITQSGIYYSPKTGNKAIDLKGVTTAPGVTVTFVAEGQIELNGAASITGHAPVATGGYSPLLMFSNAGSPPACNVNAIQYSGNGISWTGLMYAPKGEIQMSSSSNVSVFGSIIAHSVDVSGSDFAINWQDDTSGSTPLHSRAPELTARVTGPSRGKRSAGCESRSRVDGDLVE